MAQENIEIGIVNDSKGALARYNFKSKAVKHLKTFNENLKVIKEPPVSVVIHPTNACNAKCPMCRYADLRVTNETIPLEKMKEIVTELGKVGTKSIIFSGGGEPEIYQGLDEVIELAASYGIKMGMVTNHIRCSPKLNEAIVNHLSWLRVSINAATSDGYEKAQGMEKPVWPKLLDSIKKTVELRNERKTDLVIGGAYVIQQGNYKEVGDFVDLCSDLGMDYAIFRPIQKFSDTASIQAGSLGLTKDQFQEMQIIVEEKIKNNKKNWCDNNLSKIPFLFTRMDKTKDYPKCSSALVEAAIGGDGLVYPCCQHVGNPRFATGNVIEKSFLDIWSSQHSRELVDSINPQACPPCRYDFYNRVFNAYEDGWRPTNEEIQAAIDTPDSDFL